MSMRLWLLIFMLISWVTGVHAQREKGVFRPLEAYDFEDGGYEMVFLPELRYKVDSAYYTSDPQVLNRLKMSWQFEEEAMVYPFSCNDGFQVVLLRDNDILEQFEIRFRCQSFSASNRSYHYTGSGPGLIPGLNRVVTIDTTFHDLVEARTFLNVLKSDESLLFFLPVDWEEFEGMFYFNVPNPNHSGRAPTVAWKDVYDKVNSELEDLYATFSFKLQMASYGYGKHYPHVRFRLVCNKNLFDKFEYYPKTTAQWQPLKLKLRYFMR